MSFQFERIASTGNVLFKDGTSLLRVFLPNAFITADPRDSDIIKIDSDPGSAQENQMFEFKASTVDFPANTGRDDLIRKLATDFFKGPSITVPAPSPIATIPFSERLKETGGSGDMRVVGSLGSPIDFFVSADSTNDIFITNLYIFISDKNSSLEKFGNIAALTNGSLLFLEKDASNEYIAPPDIPLKSNFGYLFLSGSRVAFGDGNTAFRASDGISNSDGYIIVFNFTETMPDKGLLLRAGSSDKLIHQVRDDVTAVDYFQATVAGFKVL